MVLMPKIIQICPSLVTAINWPHIQKKVKKEWQKKGTQEEIILVD